MPEISIIVPVYNTGRYLAKCIDSVLAQTYEDFELILVDDGSTDNSPEICDRYAEKDSRVRVLHQKNQGQSVARNRAIEQMRGQWVLFIDSDDWVHPQMLERLRNAALTNKVGISICGYEDTMGPDPVIPAESLTVELWTPRDFYLHRFVNATIPVAKLIHRECLGENRFPVGKYIDDEYITYRILFTQKQLAVMAAPFYAYFVNEDSLTKREWNPRRLDAWDAYEEQIAFFTAREDWDMVRFRYRGYLDNAVVNLNAAMEKKETYARLIRQMKKRILGVIRRAWKLGYIEFWMDYDLLYACAPVRTKLYRLWLEHRRK